MLGTPLLFLIDDTVCEHVARLAVPCMSTYHFVAAPLYIYHV